MDLVRTAILFGAVGFFAAHVTVVYMARKALVPVRSKYRRKR